MNNNYAYFVANCLMLYIQTTTDTVLLCNRPKTQMVWPIARSINYETGCQGQSFNKKVCVEIVFRR